MGQESNCRWLSSIAVSSSSSFEDSRDENLLLLNGMWDDVLRIVGVPWADGGVTCLGVDDTFVETKLELLLVVIKILTCEDEILEIVDVLPIKIGTTTLVTINFGTIVPWTPLTAFSSHSTIVYVIVVTTGCDINKKANVGLPFKIMFELKPLETSLTSLIDEVIAVYALRMRHWEALCSQPLQVEGNQELENLHHGDYITSIS